MTFITPAVALVLSTVATTVTSTVQAGEARKARAKQEGAATRAASLAAGDVLRKEQLLSDKENRLRQRRAAGSGQNTILGGGGESPEIGRNVLLGE